MMKNRIFFALMLVMGAFFSVPAYAAAQSVSGIFTPDGTGTVVDNVMGSDGKEFFTIRTEDGNVFFLVVDRQRAADNVYFLSAVTEYDLLSLAKPEDGRTASGIPAQTAPQGSASAEQPGAEPPAAFSLGGIMGNGSAIFIMMAAGLAGIVGYYFKIMRPRRRAEDDGGSEDYSHDGDGDGDFDDFDDEY